MEVVNWTDWFMIQALWISQRSPDESTQHGCIIVDNDNRMLSYGYNGYPRKVDPNKMPKTRPEKYPPILHSEENAIYNCNESMKGATVYVTGPPCIHCLSAMIQKEVSKIVYGPVVSKDYKSPYLNAGPDNQVVRDLLENHEIELVHWEPTANLEIYKAFTYVEKRLQDALLNN